MPTATSYWKKRCYIGQRGIDGESWGTDDATDNWAYLDSAQGKDATIRSPTYMWDNALRFGRPGDLLNSFNIRTSIINHDVDVYYPVVPDNILLDYFLFRDTPAVVKNKTITPEFNTLDGVEKFPDYAKSGKYQGSNYKGEGILESLVHLDLPELMGDSTEGSFARYSSAVTPNKETGFWIPNNYLTMGKFDPVVKIKARLPNWSLNTSRIFFGLVSADSILINDVPFGLGDAALGIGYRNSDADFKMFRGVGNNITTIPPHSTAKTLGHSSFIIEFGFENGGNNIFYRIDNGEKITFSGDLPSPEKWLKLHVNIQNTTTNMRNLDVFYCRMETKR